MEFNPLSAMCMSKVRNLFSHFEYMFFVKQTHDLTRVSVSRLQHYSNYKREMDDLIDYGFNKVYRYSRYLELWELLVALHEYRFFPKNSFSIIRVEGYVLFEALLYLIKESNAFLYRNVTENVCFECF